MLSENEFKHNITFGAVDDLKIDFPGSRPTYITQIDADNYISPTARQMYLYQRGKQMKKIPFIFSIIEYIPEKNLLIGISLNTPFLTVLNNRPGYPVLIKDFRIPSGAVNQIVYSPQTDTLILIGYSFQFFDFKVLINRYADDPEVLICHKATVNATDLGPPQFRAYHDAPRKRLIVTTTIGYNLLSMDGEILMSGNFVSGIAVRTASYLLNTKGDMYSAPDRVVNAFKRCLITDPNGRVRIIHNSGAVISEFVTRSSGFIFSEFINSEFVVLVSDNNLVILLDIKTGKSMTIKQLTNAPKLVRLFVTDKPRLAILIDNIISIIEIVNPWSVFRKLSATPCVVRRQIAVNKAARLAVLTANSFLSLFSPSLRQFVGSAGTNIPAHVIDFIYDRGLIKYNNNVMETSQEERLFFITEELSIMAFKPDGDSFAFQNSLEMKPRIVVVGYAFEQPRMVFCCFADKGDLLLYDYEDFTPLTRISFDQKVPLFAHFHYGTGSLFIVYHREVVRMDLQSFKIVFSQKTRKAPSLAAFEDDMVMFGYDDGTVAVSNIRSDCLEEIVTFNIGGKPKYLNISQHVFLVVTQDNEVMFGQSDEDVTTVESPYPVHSASILNPDLDLLIGLDRELMVVRRREAYPWMVPAEQCEFDNDLPQLESNLVRVNRSLSSLTHRTQVRNNEEEEEQVVIKPMAPIVIPDMPEPQVRVLPHPPSPKVDRATLLKEMNRINDKFEVDNEPILTRDKPSVVIDNAPTKPKPRPPPATSAGKRDETNILYMQPSKRDTATAAADERDKKKETAEEKAAREKAEKERKDAEFAKLLEEYREDLASREKEAEPETKEETEVNEEEEEDESVSQESEDVDKNAEKPKKKRRSRKGGKPKPKSVKTPKTPINKMPKKELPQTPEEEKKPVYVKEVKPISSCTVSNGRLTVSKPQHAKVDPLRLSRGFNQMPRRQVSQSLDVKGDITLQISHLSGSGATEKKTFVFKPRDLSTTMPLTAIHVGSPSKRPTTQNGARAQGSASSDDEEFVFEQPVDFSKSLPRPHSQSPSKSGEDNPSSQIEGTEDEHRLEGLDDDDAEASGQNQIGSTGNRHNGNGTDNGKGSGNEIENRNGNSKENGLENGTEHGTLYGIRNGNAVGNGYENGVSNGTENGYENGKRSGIENGFENGTENDSGNENENGAESQSGGDKGSRRSAKGVRLADPDKFAEESKEERQMLRKTNSRTMLVGTMANGESVYPGRSRSSHSSAQLLTEAEGGGFAELGGDEVPASPLKAAANDGDEFDEMRRTGVGAEEPRRRVVQPPSRKEDSFDRTGSRSAQKRSMSPPGQHVPLVPSLPPPDAAVSQSTSELPYARQPATARANPRFRRGGDESAMQAAHAARAALREGTAYARSRIEDVDIGHTHGYRGTIITGRAPLVGAGKPLGDIEMAVIVKPLPQNSQMKGKK